MGGISIDWFNKLLGRFIPAQTLANVREGIKHPVHWVRGEGIDPDHITPWELLLYFFHRAFSSMFSGFTDKQDFLYKERFRIPPNSISVAGVVSSVWDAVNDPILGGWMDRKRLGPQALRKIMRASAITGSILTVVKLFDGGMSTWQHLAVLMFCNMTQDILGTMNGIADQKMRSGISPSSQQRGRINVWGNMGYQFSWAIANLPTVLMGFREVFGLDDYQIIFFGACIFLPFGIAAWILPTFVRQRVDYSYPVAVPQADGEDAEPPEKPTLAQTFQVVKHNRYFIANSIANFLTVFSPDMGDELMIYRYIMPKYRVFGREMGGEGLLLLKQMLSGNLSTVLQPFQRQIINRLGGPLRAQQLKCVVNIFSKLMMYLVGYKSPWRFGVLILMETLINASVSMDQVAEGLLNYEWYDYVELKTGQRSEGVTTAVDSLFKKSITNNIGQVTGNAFLDWTGFRGGYTEDGTRPPEKYLKFMWPMYTLIPVLDHAIWFTARSFVRWKPQDREQTELLLAERRAAEQALREELAEDDAP
ncbi:MAG: MFS transporter [Oscillospiraceae bacterium]|nr:MFS transporter [Oscillospiraceae bacterium]